MNGTAVIRKISTLAAVSSATLRRIWAPAWKVLSFSPADDRIYPSKTVSVSIERGKASTMYGSRVFSKISVRLIREFTFEEDRYPQPEVLASSLAFALSERGMTKADITLCIPKAWAVIRTSEFPIAVKENLPNVVSFELDRITPFSSEDAYYDFKILGETTEKITLLIAAAKADIVDQYREALGEKGIKVSRVTVNLSCLETLSRYRDDKSDSLFLEIGKEGYDGAMFINGAVLNSFSGSFPEADDRMKADTLMSEIGPHFDQFKLYGKAPRVQILFKDKSAALREMLKTLIPHPVVVLNETNPGFSVKGDTTGIPYAALGGVVEALWPKAGSMNLLSKGKHAVQKPPIALTVILLISILALWVMYIIAPLRVEEKRLQEIDRQIELRKEEVKKVEALKKEIEGVRNEIDTIVRFKTKKPMALNILKEITTILPKTAWLTRVRISETKVEMEGYAASATGILAKLESSPHLTKAEFASPTFRDTRLNADRFNIKMEIEGVQVELPKPAGKEGDEEIEE
ncbi:MAG: PilN domain-containing protein [Nitrospirota bacterium]